LLISLVVFGQYGHNQVIQGVFNNNGQTATCVLRYNGGQITAYAVDKTFTGDYNWQSMYPDNPHPTNSYQDSNWYRNYSHKVSVNGTYVYFNLSQSNGYSNRSSNSYANSTSQETIIQGVFIYNGQQNLIMLRFVGNNVMSYATSQTYNGYDWQTVRRPDNPHPTDYSDGSMQRSYKYKVSVNGTTVYFNL
jgi:hypothetical protein